MPDPQKTIYINFFDGINPTTVNKFIKFTVDAITQHNPTELYYFISSPGGDVDSGFTLYNFLISLQSKIQSRCTTLDKLTLSPMLFSSLGKKGMPPRTLLFFIMG